MNGTLNLSREDKVGVMHSWAEDNKFNVDREQFKQHKIDFLSALNYIAKMKKACKKPAWIFVGKDDELYLAPLFNKLSLTQSF